MKRFLALLSLIVASIAFGSDSGSNACFQSGGYAQCRPATGIKVDNGKLIGFYELLTNGANHVDLKASSNLASDYSLFLPSASDTLVGKATTDTLTNKTLDNTTAATFKDTMFTLQDDGSASKQAVFELSGLSAATRTYTLPDASTTLVGTGATQTLSAKTLNNTNSMTIQDINFLIQDDGSATKSAAFELSGLTTFRLFTLPDAATTLVGTGTTQTLTNKDIGSSSNTYRAIGQSASGVDTSSGQRLGTNTSDSASAGNIGEYITCNPGGSISVAASGSFVKICSLDITSAGDFDCSGIAQYSLGSTTVLSEIDVGISTSSTTIDSTVSGGYAGGVASATQANQWISSIPRRISTASTPTLYLVGRAFYSSAGTGAWGTSSRLECRRTR